MNKTKLNKRFWTVVLSTAMLLSFVQYSSNAQSTSVIVSKDTLTKKTQRIKRPKIYRTEFSGGFRLNTDGYSFFLERAKLENLESRMRNRFFKARFFSLEFTEKKHPQEVKQRSKSTASGGENPERPFIYGKMNNFYAFKLGYGGRNLIAGKPERGNVAVSWVYNGGVSVGLLKPYYVQAFVYNGSQFEEKSITYSDTSAAEFLTVQNIIGGSGFAKGIQEIKVVPGLHVRAAIHFDFAIKTNTVLAFESGFTAEIYTKKIELMALKEAFPYTANIYLAFQFGKRFH